jgi:hypothetical protein
MKRKLLLVTAATMMMALLVSSNAFAITGQRVIMPYVVSGTGSWWSGIAVHNTTNEARSVYFNARTEAGANVAGKTISIPAYGMIVNLVENLFTTPLPSTRVSIYITEGFGGSASTFRATLFVGSDTGFGFENFTSEAYTWDLVLPPLVSAE